jgi:hypothetical protein
LILMTTDQGETVTRDRATQPERTKTDESQLHPAAAAEPPAPPPAPAAVWSYDHLTGWARIPDPLPPCDGTADLTDWLASHGYGQMFDCTNVATGLDLAYFASADERFIVILGNVLYSYRVHVANLPSLIALLREVLPAVRGVADLEQKEAEFERRRKARRRGPTVYDPRRRQMRYPRADEA